MRSLTFYNAIVWCCTMFGCHFIPLSCCTHDQYAENSYPIAESFSVLQDKIVQLDKESLVIFDVDETVFALDQAPQGKISPWQRIFNNDREFLRDKHMDKKLKKVIPLAIETMLAPLIEQLQKKDIKVIALTAGGHLISGENVIKNPRDLRIHLLNALGIHFEKSFPKTKELEFKNYSPYKIYYPIFYHGILFAAPCTKGIVLKAFFNKIGWTPRQIIYFDDAPGYVDDVAKAAEDLTIPCQAFVYTGLKNLPAHAVELYDTKMHHLLANDEWLSDEKAEKKLCEQKS